MKKQSDVYSRVTDKIITDLEKGIRTWLKPWDGETLAQRISRPLRHNGVPYNGINIILLWAASMEHGYYNNAWMTFKQAKELGGLIRKGSKGELVVYANKLTRTEEITSPQTGQTEEHDIQIPYMKGYTVFNVEQIEGLPEQYYQKPEPINPDISRDDMLEAFFKRTEAAIHHGGNRAYYALQPDQIQMPYLESFRDSESYYATLAHEITHWTRHPSRLDRDLGRKSWGDEGYAREELVAELGSAFLCAELGITPEVREDHAAYIASWLEALKNDKRAIFSAASHAQKATDYLLNLTQE